MGVTEEMVGLALKLKPEFVCLVPENRMEITTEGGLDVKGQQPRSPRLQRLREADIRVTLFIDPDFAQVDAAQRPAPHDRTPHRALCRRGDRRRAQRRARTHRQAVAYGRSLGLTVNAGHGLTYHNVQLIAALPGIHELNIGHTIVAQALFVGWKEAVAEMKRLMVEAAR